MTNALSQASKLHIDLDEDAEAGTLPAIVDEDAPLALDAGDTDVVDEDINPLDKLPERAVKNADGSVTLPLGYPVPLRSRKDGKIKERNFTELVFHRLNGADQRAVSATSDENMTVVAFSRSTRINQAVMNALFDKMDAYDITNCGRVLNHFLNNGPKTGR